MTARLALAALAASLAFPAAAVPMERPKALGSGLVLAYDGVVLVKVLDIRVEQRFGDDAFTATARLKSHGVLSVFKKMDVSANAAGRLEGFTANPAAFDHVNQDGKENRRVKVRWGAADVSAAIAPAYRSMGDPAPTPAQKVAAADPLTQLTRFALSASETGPCGRTTRFFDGRQLYQVEFGPPEPRVPRPREQGLGFQGAIGCSLTFNEIAGFDRKPPEKKNQGLRQPMRIEFAKASNQAWVVTAVRGRTPLGEAKIELVSAQVH
jgi:hypothetical protein